jgi:pimeloyl-ACP methyl ester carboxylesterase
MSVDETPIFFLPGAGGSASFWRPLASQLGLSRPVRFFSWPGLGNEPHDRDVQGIDDLVSRVVSELNGPTDLVAQSMGGMVALKVALAAPAKVRRLVLAVTSGGLPIADAADWREEYRRDFPSAASWITTVREDMSHRLSAVLSPTLLLWGDRDPISPVPVGERLAQLLPNSRLHVVKGGGHDLAISHADEIAPIVVRHLTG